MKKLIAILIFLLCFAGVIGQTQVEIYVNDIQGGKPPLKFYVSDIKINNTQDKACWILFPGYADDSLVNNGIFNAEKPWKIEYIVGRGYRGKTSKGGSGKTTEIHFLGKYEESFHAFLVPGKSTLYLQNYLFESSIALDSVEYACAEALMINDSIELEKFLPYKIISDKNLKVDISKNSNWNNLSYDKKNFKKGTSLPKNEVQFIHATKMKIVKILPLTLIK